MHTITSRFLTFICALAGAFSAATGASGATAAATVGQAVTFSVDVSGTAPFSYQWYKDSVALSGGTAATFAISSVQASSAGSYTVLVSNAYGSTNSDSGMLTVTQAVAPTFSLQPAGATVAAGGTATFSALAGGTPAPAYQWYFNGAAISGATSATLTISSAQSANAGSYTVIATNAAGSVTSSVATLVVSGTGQGTGNSPVSVWSPSKVPAVVDAGADSAVELGMKFKSDVAGVVTGVRFYKAAANTGTHVGNLWSGSGARLASATFVGEGASGWQQVTFASPVAIAANTVYTVSYFCPAGHYSDDWNFFATSGTDAPPLHALANGASGSNGVFAYGSSGAFPTQSWNSCNYWVDVIFQAAAVATLKSVAVTPSAASLLEGATQSFVATATFSDGSTQDITASATWTSSNAGVASIGANGIANGTGAGAATITVTYSGLSASSTLTVSVPNVAPVISTPPASQAVTAGQSVTFSVAASGTPAPTYQWQFNGKNISGATNATYTIASAQAANAGTYAVVATNVVASVTSAAATLTVNPANSAPAFTTQPTGRVVTAGTAVTFSAAATGVPAPTYQWQFNGKNISGATNATYTIASAQAANAGTYTVVATNVVASVTSAAATLTVNSAPVFTTQPVGQVVNVGSSVTFVAAATGTPAPTYQWKKNGTTIAGATASSYTISAAQSSSAGTYSVVATNSVGAATSAGAVLIVNAALPVITTQPFSQTLTAGGAVTFFVVASSSSSLTYQWYKNGAKISRATLSSYAIASTATSDGGTYTVTVTNGAGAVTGSAAVLTVHTTTPPAVYRVDFNGDGKSDILWQDSLTGACRVWLMSGTKLSSSVTLGSRPGWTLVGAGDFNGDGKSDVLWQNLVTGEVSVWLMAGTKISSTVSLGTVALGWEACGTGDFNGDGKSDILWQNNLTGDRSIWLMSGTTVSSAVDLGDVSLDWQIAGAGDFNADGRSDIVWQDSVTGQCTVWLMAGTVPQSVVSLGTVALGWEISGGGDFNANGKSDLLLQNSLTGACQVWLMSGTTVSSTVSLGSVTLDWVIQN
ncbi:MAG TPA: immunoglobulin domain-containing protein [Candidatus Didemnitutus sp.]